MMSLKRLLSGALTDGLSADAVPSGWCVSGIECDSRLVKPGDVFIAVRGAKQDGACFIEEAVLRGARVVVTESVSVPAGVLGQTYFCRVADTRLAAARLAAAFHGYPASHIKAIGITGTNGKTTSSYLIEYFLSSQAKRTGVLGTISTRFGGREVPARETTPGPLILQKILSEMVSASCEYVVMEISSHALHQKRTEGIGFSSALFTNLTRDHLDYHGSMKNYFESKALLFTNLEKESTAVLNADDNWSMKLSDRCRAGVVTYGVCRPADLKADNLSYGAASTRFDLSVSQEATIGIVSPLVGVHNVYNVLGALAVLKSLGLSVERCAKRLHGFPGVPGRLESVNVGQDFRVFVDFAHTPDGLENVLQSLAPCKTRKLILVFGCGGDRDRGKRPKMAEIAARHCDHVVVTSDNPRSEDPLGIIGEICAGFPAGFKNYTAVPDRRKAVRQALLAARKGDIVLLAGKGHERAQIIGDTSIPFSDRDEAEKVLSGR